MKARNNNGQKKGMKLISLLIAMILVSSIFVVNAAAESKGILQGNAIETALATSQGNAEPSNLFTVDRWQEEDYSANLHPEKYLSYYSDYDDFFFSYPPHLYCAAGSSFDPYECALGRNVETHLFLGSEGSALSFALFNRMDNLNLKAAKDNILAAESKEITVKRKTLLDEADKSKRFSRFVVTGYNDDGMIVYTLVKVTPDKVMRMRIECPPYCNHDDEMEKRYVQECIYRYCSFAKEKLDQPRSYTEFLRSDKK